MKIRNRISFFLSAAIISIAAFSADAQVTRPDFNRPQTFDVQHYIIRADFDRARKRVMGDTTVQLKPLKPGFRAIELDAVGMSFESVKLEPAGIDLKYRTVGGRVVITLDKAYGPEDLIAVRLKYTATPKKGVYFVPAATGPDRANHSEQIWTQGEPDEARHWFPSFDFPSDKATTEKYITARKGETVIGNGELVSRTEHANGTETWHYRMSVPHTTYLVSFIIGKYVKIEDKFGDIPFGYYVYPGKESLADSAYGRTTDMMEHFESLTGIAYPFNKYDQTMVANFTFGGMENITATTMDDQTIFLADTPMRESVMDLVSHELAHSWFGNMVTCRNWAELWLNEGFATYLEAVYREKAFGRDNYMAKVRTDAAQFLIGDMVSSKRHGLFNLRAGNVSELFDNPSTTYSKGGVVLHMLREQIGTAAFWKGVNIYLTRHKFGSVETPDLIKAMEESSKQNLGWFFDQWVYGTRSPELDIRPVYNPRAKTLTLNITQTQKAVVNVPAAFRLPINVEIETAEGTKSHSIDIKQRIETISLPAPEKPTAVIIDREEKVPLKTVKLRPMTSLP